MEHFEDFLSNPEASILSNSSNTIRGSIRSSIRSQVDDVLWMNDVNQKLESIAIGTEGKNHSKQEIQRCAVCTLPVGTCSHSTPWLQSSLHSSMLSSVDSELDQVFGVLDKSLVVESKPEWRDVDIHNIQWCEHTPRIADRIGDSFLPLSMPPERGWHSLDNVGKYLVLFGGLRFKDRSKAPEPYGSVIRLDDVEYLSDVYIYDTENLSWHSVIPKESDHTIRQNWPCGRYGHATATLDKNHLIIFGGRTSGGRYLSDTWIFSLATYSWTAFSRSSDDTVRPPPRAFSAMAASPSTRSIILYGGTNGVEVFGDIWIFKWGAKSFESEQVEMTRSVCNVNENPDPMMNGSLGLLSSEFYWGREVAVGGSAPPPPRYGHKLLIIVAHPDPYGGGRKTKLQNGTFLVVVGGCCVSPSKELEGRESNAGAGGALPPSEIKKLLQLCKTLQDRYASEGNFSAAAGREILSHLDEMEARCGVPSGQGHSQSLSDIRDIVKRSAVITGRLAEMEKQTRILESDLTEAWFEAQALSLAIRNSSTHASATIGIHFLCVDDMAWVPQIHPKITGDLPSSRMHHGTVILGDFLFVFGGIKPTALSHSLVDQQYTKIYALDLRTLVWEQVNTIDSTCYLEGPFRVADADIRRAQEQVEVEKARGISANARGGITVELMEAEAVLTVCKWRKSMLLQEQKELRPPPIGAWGFASCVVPSAGDPNYLGSRAIFHGGWNRFGSFGGINHRINDTVEINKERNDNFTNCFIILDCEDELERRRRLEEEFHAKLERERQEQLSKAMQLEIQSLFELRMALKKEEDNRQRELKAMGFEDYLSSLPPLSKPLPVQLVKANEHTLWVKWQRSLVNTVGKRLDPKKVTYYLYMSGGYVAYNPGDRVCVLPPQELSFPSGETPLNPLKDQDDEGSDNESDEDSVEAVSKLTALDKNEFGKPKKVLYVAKPKEKLPYNGEIIGVKRGTGCFTIRADDGSLEKNVPRSRLRSLLLAEEDEFKSTNSLSFLSKRNKSPPKLSKRQVSYQKAQKLLKESQRKGSGHDRLGKDWKLVYCGDKLEYATEGLIPWDALQREPGIVVNVNFCLRTTGVDYPEDEYSDASETVTFSTTWSNLEDTHDQDALDPYLQRELKMSKTRKEVIKAVLSGQKTIELERRNDVVCSEGVFDSFL